jgi:hypothetical protein
MKSAESDSIRTSNVIMTGNSGRVAPRICPCYRLAQLIPDRETAARDPSLPICVALEPVINIERDRASRLCRSGEFPSCDRFRAAYPNWNPANNPRPARANATTTTAPHPEDFRQHVLSSLMWVIGIPTGITIAIILAIWFTENVWMPTESFLLPLLS